MRFDHARGLPITCEWPVNSPDGFCEYCIKDGHQAETNKDRCQAIMTSGKDEGMRCLATAVCDGYCLHCFYNEPVAKIRSQTPSTEEATNVDKRFLEIAGPCSDKNYID
jgi:hypothetical protein